MKSKQSSLCRASLTAMLVATLTIPPLSSASATLANTPREKLRNSNERREVMKSGIDLMYDAYVQGQLPLHYLLMEIVNVENSQDFRSNRDELRLLIQQRKADGVYTPHERTKVQTLELALNNWIRSEQDAEHKRDKMITATFAGTFFLFGGALGAFGDIHPYSNGVKPAVQDTLNSAQKDMSRFLESRMVRVPADWIGNTYNRIIATGPSQKIIGGTKLIGSGIWETADNAVTALRNLLRRPEMNPVELADRTLLKKARQSTGILFLSKKSLKAVSTIDFLGPIEFKQSSMINDLGYAVQYQGENPVGLLLRTELPDGSVVTRRITNPFAVKGFIYRETLSQQAKRVGSAAVWYITEAGRTVRSRIQASRLARFLTSSGSRARQLLGAEAITGATLGAATGYGMGWLINQYRHYVILDSPFEDIKDTTLSTQLDNVMDTAEMSLTGSLQVD